jgi:hypothetical protein
MLHRLAKAFDRVNWTKLMQIIKETGAKEHCSANFTWLSVLQQTGPKGEKTCDDWKMSKTRMLFVTDSIQLFGACTS